MCDVLFFFKQKTAYEMRISDWSSDVCSSDLRSADPEVIAPANSDALLPEDVQPQQRRQRSDRRDLRPEVAADDIGIDHRLMRRAGDPRRIDRQRADEIGRASCRERGCQYV